MKTFSKSEVMFLEADQKLQKGFFDEGLKILEKIIEKDPGFAPAYNHIGWLYLVNFSNLKKAEQFFKKTIELDPEYAAVYPNYALVLSSLERFEELEELVSKSLKIQNIEKSALYYELATMFEIQENYSKAKENLQKAISSSLSAADIRFYEEAMERLVIKKSLLK